LASHCLCPFFDGVARYQFLIFSSQAYRDFVQALSRVIGAGAAISYTGGFHETS
jgi:hypothetical protein